MAEMDAEWASEKDPYNEYESGAKPRLGYASSALT
jgi:hypothetical protein